MAFGTTFQPGTTENGAGQPGQPRANPVQNAIKFLSLRMPNVVGARSPVNPALLAGAQPGRSPHVDRIVDDALKKVLGPEQTPTAPMVTPPAVAAPVSMAQPNPAPGGFGGAPVAVTQGPRPIFSSTPAPAPSPAAPVPAPVAAAPEPVQAPRPAPSQAPTFTFDQAPSPAPPVTTAPSVEPKPTQPIQMPRFNGEQQGLITEATNRVGAGADWNSYQQYADSDPFVKMFASMFGRGGNWNALRPGG